MNVSLKRERARVAMAAYRLKHPERARESVRKCMADPIRREKYVVRMRERNRARKQWGIEYKGGICVDCGAVYPPAVMEFHHLDPTEKDDNEKMLYSSFEKAKAELDKCVLLCANCHRIRHAS